MTMRRRLWCSVVACVVAAMGVTEVRADNGEQLGFIVDEDFSTFLTVDGEIVFDLFGLVGDLPGFFGFINTNSTFLADIGFFRVASALPDPFALFELAQELGEFTGRFKLVYAPDPFVMYELDVQNTTDAPQQFELSISPPIVPVIGENVADAQLSINLIDANNDGTVRLSPGDDGFQRFFVIDETFVLQDTGISLGDDIFEIGVTAFSAPLTNGPSSDTGWQFIDVLLNFTLSPGDRVIIRGMAGIGNPGTFLPQLDDVNFSSLDALDDCASDGNDDDQDGVPNGCDVCPDEDDLIDENADGTPDCAEGAASDDDANDDDVDPDDEPDADDGDDDRDGNVGDEDADDDVDRNDDPPQANDDKDNDTPAEDDDAASTEDDAPAPPQPPSLLTLCGFGAFNALPLMFAGLLALHGRTTARRRQSP